MEPCQYHKNLQFTNIIAGPCSAENRNQIIETAKALKKIGISIMRAGLWKPRSRYGTFEGVGKDGIPWLKEVQQAYGIKIMTEVALPSHVEAALKAGIDMLWIGARTTVNPFMITELAESLKGTEIPIFIKNPVCPDLSLWIGCIERLQHAGINHLNLIHRGFCLLKNSPYRNFPLWDFVNQIRNDFPTLPIYCDPSHIAGKRELILNICEEAINHQQYDGLFIESHINPKVALSDAEQQITPTQLKETLIQLLQKRKDI